MEDKKEKIYNPIFRRLLLLGIGAILVAIIVIGFIYLVERLERVYDDQVTNLLVEEIDRELIEEEDSSLETIILSEAEDDDEEEITFNIPEDNPYRASTAKERANEIVQEKNRDAIEELEEIYRIIAEDPAEVPESFTWNETLFFTLIMQRIDDHVELGKKELLVSLISEYAVWTDQLLAYMDALGYKIIINEDYSLISWN